MAEVDEFLGSVLPTLHEMEMAFHNGDVGPRMATWSHNDHTARRQMTRF